MIDDTMSDQLPSKARPWRERMFEPIDSTILVWVRIAVGVTFVFWARSFLAEVKVVGGDAGAYENLALYQPAFLEPRFLFKYWGFEWVKLWPGNGIYWHFVVTAIAGVCLAVGLLTRLSAAILCASMAYVLLVERQIYNNHYYLLSCIAGLLVFLPVGRRFSKDAVAGIERRDSVVPRWQLWLIRFQLGIPYVFGAIAKLNYDWLMGQPSGFILSHHADTPVIGPYVTTTWAIMLMAYGGLLYDLLVVPMLFYRRTRWLAVVLSLIFHLTNAATLTIGVFPWFMLATLVVFFPADTLPKILTKMRIRSQADGKPDSESAVNQLLRPNTAVARAGFKLAIIYVAIQLMLPARPAIMPGNSQWNERGHRYAWRMMLRSKDTLTAYKIVHEESGKFLFVPSTVVMTPYQASRAERDPELIRQAAVELQKRAAELGFPGSKIHALALISLNGRRPVPIIDPTVDLTKVQRGWLVDDWVLQDPGVFRKQPWPTEKQRWWQTLVLPDPFKPLQRVTPDQLNEYLNQLNATQQQPDTAKKTSP